MKLRPPRPGDEAALAELSGQLGYPSSEAQIRRRLEDIRSRDDQAIVVAEDDAGRPVGWIHVLVSHRLASDAFAEVTGLVVSDLHRGAGIGEKLLEAAETWARRRGLLTVRVRSNVIRERAHGFYLRHGYEVQKTSRVFAKQLDPGGDEA